MKVKLFIVNNMRLILDIHSFIDIITNSSTEIYVSVDNSAIQSIKELINGMLAYSNSNKTCDDIFDIKIIDAKIEEWLENRLEDFYEEECSDIEDLSINDFEKIKSLFYEKYSKEVVYEMYEDYCNRTYDYYPRSYISVEVKESSKELEQVANVLNRLRSLFNINASYN